MNPWLLLIIAFTPMAIALGIAHFNEWRDRNEALRPDRERDRVNRALARTRRYPWIGRAS